MMLLHLERMLEKARVDYEAAMKVYDSGGVIVEYDTDYYEGQVLAFEQALEVAKIQAKSDWIDGYTSGIANAREAGYITEEQYDDLYTEVGGL